MVVSRSAQPPEENVVSCEQVTTHLQKKELTAMVLVPTIMGSNKSGSWPPSTKDLIGPNRRGKWESSSTARGCDTSAKRANFK